MDVRKARKILNDHPKNNYKIKKTLMDNGYTKGSAEKAGGLIMARAVRTVAKDISKQSLGEISKQTRSAIEILGMNEQEVTGALRTIALNQRDYASALKVLGVLATEVGVNLTSEEQKTQPLLNITVESGNSDKEPDNITGHLSSTVVEKTADDTVEIESSESDDVVSDEVEGVGGIGEEEGER